MPGIDVRNRRLIAIRSIASLAVMGALVGCQSDAPTSTPIIGDVSLAKGGSGGSGGAPPTVTATDPSSAVQDTTIDVSIFGSGFTAGAKATWSLGGDTTKVHVKSTKVVDSGKLIARIEVPPGAPVAKYDVEVTLLGGKKGVGAEMFEVQYGDPTAAFWFPLDDASLGLRSDHQYVSGTSSVYAQNVCGVASKIFATTENSNSGDALLHTTNPRYAAKQCALYPRKLTIEYGPGDVESITVFMNVRNIANTTYQIPIGTTVRRALSVQGGRCAAVRFITQAVGGPYLGADSVNVTRTSANSWLVETQPYPNNKALCNATGQMHNIVVRFTVIADRALP